MKKILIVATVAFVAQNLIQAAFADDDFYGIIESRPAGKAGT